MLLILEIKQTFDSVDVDGSGLVEWAEFAFSLMGEKPLQFRTLADLEILNELLDVCISKLTAISKVTVKA